MPWVSVIGLSFDLVGAFILAYGLFISEDGALELGQSRFSGDTKKANLQLPQVRDRLRQSRNAKIGVSFLIVGFALQIIANWP